MDKQHTSTTKSRLGFHYFPDTDHFRESDLNLWLPKLKSLGAGWLTLLAPVNRAIPEYFISKLFESGIEPVLHFDMQIEAPLQPDSLALILNSYAKWGIRYIIFFNRPNSRTSWASNSWTQSDLVERFLDIYLPLAETALQAGLSPVFPPLEPGGDYWDTAFLRAALHGIQRRGHTRLLKNMALSAYAWSGDRPLNWGAGGPERWPGARPYFTPSGQQDQRGFYIFDWYLALAKAVLGETRPILLMGVGNQPIYQEDSQPTNNETIQTERTIALAKLISGYEEIDGLEAIPPEVQACNFWLLTSGPDSPYEMQSWFRSGGGTLPVVGALQQWFSGRNHHHIRPDASPSNHTHKQEDLAPSYQEKPTPSPDYPIAHYLLIPIYEWGIADWHLDVIRPYVKKFRPTIGFSLEEARFAEKITVIGGPQTFSEEALDELRASGCIVERISGDGTSIATQLETL
jgi:hypothetical protein